MEYNNILYIYTRVSTSTQSLKGYSLEAQKKIGIEKANFLNMSYRVFEERGHSAAIESIENRIELKKLLNLCEEGKVKNIFVTEWDRITRNQITQAYIKKIFKDNKIMLFTANQQYNLENYDDEFISDLSALLAVRENKIRVERSQRGKIESVKKGKWHGGLLPFGYTKDKDNTLIIDSEEEVIYKEIIKMSLSGFGCNSIAKELNSRNIKTKGSKLLRNGIFIKDKFSNNRIFKKKEDLLWKANTILTILKNPLYKGKRRYKEDYHKAPAIISEDVWLKVQQNLINNKIKSPRSNNKYFYLLRGLLKCNRCDRYMYGLIKPKKGMRLYCCSSNRPDPIRKHCKMKNINIDKIESLVWNTIITILQNSNFAKKQYQRIFSRKNDTKIIQSNLTYLKGQLKSKNEEISIILNLYGKKLIPYNVLENKSKELELQLNDISNSIKEKEIELKLSLEKSDYNILSITENELKKLNELTPERKRKMLNILISSIEVDYLDEYKEHVIIINLKLPLLHKDKNSVEFLLNGTYIPDELNDHIITTPHQSNCYNRGVYFYLPCKLKVATKSNDLFIEQIGINKKSLKIY